MKKAAALTEALGVFLVDKVHCDTSRRIQIHVTLSKFILPWNTSLENGAH